MNLNVFLNTVTNDSYFMLNLKELNPIRSCMLQHNSLLSHILRPTSISQSFALSLAHLVALRQNALYAFAHQSAPPWLQVWALPEAGNGKGLPLPQPGVAAFAFEWVIKTFFTLHFLFTRHFSAFCLTRFFSSTSFCCFFTECSTSPFNLPHSFRPAGGLRYVSLPFSIKKLRSLMSCFLVKWWALSDKHVALQVFS